MKRVILSGYRTGTESATSLTRLEEADPPAGDVRVRTTYLQIPAVTADLMRADPGLPMPGFRIGEPIWGPGVGMVVESRDERLPVGTSVLHRKGWQDEVVVTADEVYPVHPSLPEPYFALNQGVTAYHGMVDIAEIRAGDVVFVSGAAGGVGSLAGQIARNLGAATVIGSAGSAQKVRYLVEELGFDAAINYRDGDLAGQLVKIAPDGIDVFYDNTGGEAFEAAVKVAAHGARFALCGAVSGQLDGGDGAYPRLDVMTAIVKELVIKPFCTPHTPDQVAAWYAHYGRWLAEGKLVYPRTVVDGNVEDAPKVLDDMLAGRYRGNVLLRIG
ncbi:MDR family NADP-dependent oxidoreductase [Fodinicola acaciae]|uniref:MDR family NADP-dependent oxidoreductase n=1 Tax=Fodinicola acaciae TaxID=2681555 RepID=UPI0013D19CDF|nr:NADP-dependent oxidoreductase [Fodinicola acaciae]